MKTTVKIMAVALLAVSACQNASQSKQDFIPGTYVDSVEGEYGKAKDTVNIKHLDGPNYQIEFRTTYQAIREGKLSPVRHKKDILGATWDAHKEQLIENVSQSIYTFQPDKHTLMLNSKGVLQKIN